MVININVENKIARTVGDARIVCGNADYTVNFTFDEEWTAAIKTARFVYIRDGHVEYLDVVIDSSTAAVPILSDVQEVRVGVYAGDLHTTTPAVIPCERSIRCGTGAPGDPTPSQYDQIMALLEEAGGVPGKDGVSPTVEIIDIEDGHRIVITDVNGEHSYDVTDDGSGSIVVDASLNEDSENPVQNKAIAGKITEIETTVGNIDILLQTI